MAARFALLGLGRAGHFHLQSIRLLHGAELECVFDIDSDRARSVASEYDCRMADQAKDAIDNDQVDAVIIATPTDTHFDYVQLALECGKAVFTEKPLGRQLDQIDSSFDQAKAKNLPLFVAFQRRFDPSFAQLVSASREGQLGQIQFVRSVSRDNPVPSMAYIGISGGIYHDCIVHDLDMVLQITGEKPSHISSFASSFIEGIGKLDDFDNVACSLSFPSGAVATIDVSRKGVFGYDQRLEAFGDQGMLQAENSHTSHLISATANGVSRAPIELSFPTRYREAYVAEIECFLECLRGERKVPITHDDVRTNFLLASGLELAAREKRVVAFDEIESLL